MKCYICQCNVSIPVIINCFPCFTKNKIHCNTYTRVCFECMIRFLQLNQSSYSRTNTLKCLTCDAVVNPRTLTFENSFDYDFFLQRVQMTGKEKCPYCFLDFDNIFSHLDECGSCYTQCVCGYVTIRDLFDYHIYSCSDHISCFVCSKFIKVEHYNVHLEECHSKKMCSKCREIVDESHYSLHENFLCKFRLVRCRFCGENFEFHSLNEHLEEHKEELKETIELLKKLLKKMYERHFEITREQNIYFERFFLTG